MINLKNISLILFMTFVSGVFGYAQEVEKEWMLGPFERFKDAQPIIKKNSETKFKDPMTNRIINWESMATFNPAAIVKDGKIHVFYRAEEKLGEKEIGGHTSRIGLAISEDGQKYIQKKQPVFYPDEDDQKQYEWTGGTEDPRIVETAENMYVLTYTQWNRSIPRLAVATSSDLENWEKHGPIFEKWKE